MTELPLLLDNVLNPIPLCVEYEAVCARLGFVVGTSLEDLLAHQWAQGAQVAALEPGGA